MDSSPYEHLVAFFRELERVMPSSGPRHAITWEIVEDGLPLEQGTLLLHRNLGDCYFPIPLTKELLDTDPVAAAQRVAKTAEAELARHPDRIYEYR
jgi:hypothetical protein